MAASLKVRMRTFIEANQKRAGSPCSTCALPPEVLEAIRAERASGTHFSTLADFLRAEGFKMNRSMLAYHFDQHEQRKG